MTDTRRQPTWFDDENAVELPEGFAWTPQEQWAWARVLRGDIADMGLFDPALPRENFAAWYAGKDDGAGADANAVDENGALAPWPDSRVLRDVFLRLILFQKPFSTAPSRARIRISCARIEEPLVWSAERYSGDMLFTNCRFAALVTWQRLRVGGLLSLQGARFEAALNAAGVETGGYLFCRDGFTAKGEVNLIGAKIGGDADFIGAKLEGGLNAERLQTSGYLFCRNGFTAKGPVNLLGANIGGNVELSAATLEGVLNAADLETGGNLFCRNGFNAKGLVTLLGAKIGGNAEFTRAMLEDGLQAAGIETGGYLICRDGFTVKGEVNLLGAKIGKNAEFDGASLEGGIVADGADISGALFLRRLTRLRDAKFVRVRVGGNAQLWGSTFEGVIDFTGARITGELQTAQNEDWPRWGSGARLILRNARLGALAGGAGSFPLKSVKDKPPMDLAGLSYERLGGLGADTGGSLAKDGVRALKGWLAAGHAAKEYTPGPYRTLANALVEAGQAREANEILHAMHRQEARCEQDFWRWVRLHASGMFIGFGYRNWYAIIWFFLLVTAGAAYGLYLTNFHPLEVSVANFDEFRRWFGFSFGNAIPVVTLDKAHETFLAMRFVGADADAVQKVPIGIAWAFYIQKVVGFIILSYLAAGVTGLATRQRD